MTIDGMVSIRRRAPVLAQCEALGFARAGIAPAQPIDYADELRDWLGANKHGEMRWLEHHTALRIDPTAMLPGCQSIIVVADWYADGSPDESTPGHGRIARYARGDDYHTSMKKRLQELCDALRCEHPQEQFRACVDTAPVMEREHAARAGIGYVGKHTLLIEPGVGSYFFLGEILTTLAIEPEPIENRVEDHCGTCTRCIDACPTDAIASYTVDATKCISYLTIEHRSLIEKQYHEAIDDWIFGCDICQEVCPHNGDTEPTRAVSVNPAYAPRRSGFDLLEVLNWNEENRRSAFVHSALKRAKLNMIKRNALIAAGNYLRNHTDEALERRITELAQCEQRHDHACYAEMVQVFASLHK